MVVALAVAIRLISRSAGERKAADKVASAQKKAKVKSPIYFPVDELVPTAAVIRVNGAGITKADYMNWYRLKLRLFCVRNNLPPGSKDKRMRDFKKNSRANMCANLVTRELMRQYAVTNGVTPSAERVAAAEVSFAKKMGHKDGDFGALLGQIGKPYEEMLRAAIFAEEREKACVEFSTTNNLKEVTKAEAEAQMKLIKEMNARAEQKNIEQKAKAIRAKQDILGLVAAGTPFAEAFASVTTNCAEIAKEEGLEWDTLELGELEPDEPIARWLMVAREGDISDPIDMEDGLAIVGLKRKYMGEVPDEGVDLEPEMQHEVVRCAFYAHDLIEEPDSLDELATEMLADRRRRATVALGDRLAKVAMIDYPYGEKIFRLTKRKSKMPKGVRGPAPKKAGDKQEGAKKK